MLQPTISQTTGYDRQVVKFIVTGLINTGVDWGVYLILTRLTVTFSSVLVAAKVFSFAAASVVAFLLHRFWTFERTGPVTGGEIVKFYTTTITGIIINATAMHVFIPMVGNNDVIALGIATSFTMIWNFIFLKFWVYTPRLPQSASL